MEAEIKDGKLIISIEIHEAQSKSGKSLVIASTGGNKPLPIEYKGKPVILGLNAYIKNQ